MSFSPNAISGGAENPESNKWNNMDVIEAQKETSRAERWYKKADDTAASIYADREDFRNQQEYNELNKAVFKYFMTGDKDGFKIVENEDGSASGINRSTLGKLLLCGRYAEIADKLSEDDSVSVSSFGLSIPSTEVVEAFLTDEYIDDDRRQGFTDEQIEDATKTCLNNGMVRLMEYMGRKKK